MSHLSNSSPYYPYRQASYEALRKTSLEWTRVANGFFMDYWGIARGLASHMAPIPDLAVDIAHKKAAIPGTGDETVCMTYTYDLARYLSAFLADTESKWEETTYFVGDRITLNAFVKTAESVTGEFFFFSSPVGVHTLRPPPRPRLLSLNSHVFLLMLRMLTTSPHRNNEQAPSSRSHTTP